MGGKDGGRRGNSSNEDGLTSKDLSQEKAARSSFPLGFFIYGSEEAERKRGLGKKIGE